MPNTREVRLRIRSVKNIAQVTRALQAVSASKVRKSMQALDEHPPVCRQGLAGAAPHCRPAGQGELAPAAHTATMRSINILVVVVTGDRGLAGAYTTNIVRYTLRQFGRHPVPVNYITVGRKGSRYDAAPPASQSWPSSATCRLRRPLPMFRRSAGWRWTNT